MNDPRMDRLAEILVNHSTRLKAGEKVLIECFDLPESTLPCALIAKSVERGALPLVSVRCNSILRELWRNGNAEQLRLIGQLERARMKQVQAYIGIRGTQNVSEMSDVPADKMELFQTYIWTPSISRSVCPRPSGLSCATPLLPWHSLPV